MKATRVICSRIFQGMSGESCQLREAAGLHAEQEPGCGEAVGTGKPGAREGAAR